jgi:hypothetical protein
MRRLALSSLVLALVLASCGGDEETVTVTSEEPGSSQREDEAAIEKLIVEYGKATGAESCAYFSAGLVAKFGGPRACNREYTGTTAVSYKVTRITVKGDRATATASSPDATYIYRLVREGKPNDPNRGWRLSDFREAKNGANAREGGGAEPPPPEPSAPDHRALIEQMMSDFSATDGSKACSFFSAGLLAVSGGLEECKRRLARLEGPGFTVEKIDRLGPFDASVAVSEPGKTGTVTFEVTIQGGPSDPYGGWKISELP